MDPAEAAAPPETDVVRAIYEGLTNTDPKTFDAVPGVAERWTTTSDYREWTFQIRRNAKWSNGKPVTADDFVRSWNRLAGMGNAAARPDLLRNFARAEVRPEVTDSQTHSKQNKRRPNEIEGALPDASRDQDAGKSSPNPSPVPQSGPPSPAAVRLAITVEGDLTLTVKLVSGDRDLPKLLADPMFSPVFANNAVVTDEPKFTTSVTNGPFRIASFGKDGVLLERSTTYWNRDAVKLDTVKFVPAETVDDALEAYRLGVVDVVTNVEYEPPVLKLLAPYEDFRRTTHGAVNLYEFNISRAPFSDRRIREALAISIERERLTVDEMDGVTRPATRFLPVGGDPLPGIVEDTEKAKSLFESAGFPKGEGFPKVKLVVNRNDTQLRVARAIARMWKNNLNVDTEVIIKEQPDMDEVRQSGDFDLIRRGIVFPTADTRSNLASIFLPDPIDSAGDRSGELLHDRPSNSALTPPFDSATPTISEPSPSLTPATLSNVPTESQALYEMRAIPLYFPTSYSLVKPYVLGFDANGLDIYSLRDVMINNDWQPVRPGAESN